MVASVLDTLDELRSRPGATNRCVELDRCAPQTDQEKKAFFAGYEQAMGQLRSRWGAPAFEGPGPRGGYQGRDPASHLGSVYYYCAVRMAWWQMKDDVAMLMATEHDAGARFCLIVAVVAGRADPSWPKMTKAEFLRAWEADPWGIPLPPDKIPVAWMRAAWKIDAVREATLDLMGQNVSKAGRLGDTVEFLKLLDKALGRRQVMDVYCLLRDFEPHRETDWREEFERGFPSHRPALPPVRSEKELIALLGREQAVALGVIKEQG